MRVPETGQEGGSPPKPHVFDSFKDAFSLTLKARVISANVRKPSPAFTRCQIHCFGWRDRLALGQWNRLDDLLKPRSQHLP